MIGVTSQMPAGGVRKRSVGARKALGRHLNGVTDRSTTYSEVASTTFAIGPNAAVEWQIVEKNRPVDHAAWQPASGFADWSFSFATAEYGKGAHTIVVRVVQDGLELSQKTVSVNFK
jgi:hypothetical protein